jgi:hypothetical protein
MKKVKSPEKKFFFAEKTETHYFKKKVFYFVFFHLAEQNGEVVHVEASITKLARLLTF